jgi:hypothetical protein
MNFAGQTVICIASGPSLTEDDCEHATRSHPTIAVNNSWQRAKACTIVYASDYIWWQRYLPTLTSSAERWTNNRKAAKDYKLNLWLNDQGFSSGLAAIHLAMWFGAARILLLGYDCKPAGNQMHWHGRHEGGLNNPNEMSFRIWAKQYRQTSRQVRERVVNCSRDTSIACFPRSTLEQALEQPPLREAAR